MEEQWLVAALQGHVGLPVPERALTVAEEHRVDGLVGARLLASETIPPDERARWQDHLKAVVAVDAARHAELSLLCVDMRAAGATPLLLKGAGIAYTHYATSWQRPQDDVDIWCRSGELELLQGVLEHRGYVRSPMSRPDATGQVQFVRRDSQDVHHQVELHLRMLTPVVFADVLSFDEALAQARPIQELGGTLTLGSTHALLLACLHRVAHHFRSPRLIWLYDVALIARSMSNHEWDALRALAERSATRAVVRANLDDASAWFAIDVPEGVMRALRVSTPEPSAAFLNSGVREIDVQWSNLQHAPSWKARRTLLRKQVLPPAGYMRARYGTGSVAMLPALYLWRLLSGAPRWLVRYSRRHP